jgi:hypothetical protein
MRIDEGGMGSTFHATMRTAVISLVGESGVANLTPEAVCARADVPIEAFGHVWPDVRSAVLDVVDRHGNLDVVPDTGCLTEDLNLYVEHYLERCSDPAFAAFIFRVIADSKVDRDLARALEPGFMRRRARNREVIDRAIGRGELPADANVDAILDAVLMQNLAWIGRSERPTRLAIGAALQRAVERGCGGQPRLAEIRKPSVT